MLRQFLPERPDLLQWSPLFALIFQMLFIDVESLVNLLVMQGESLRRPLS